MQRVPGHWPILFQIIEWSLGKISALVGNRIIEIAIHKARFFNGRFGRHGLGIVPDRVCHVRGIVEVGQRWYFDFADHHAGLQAIEVFIERFKRGGIREVAKNQAKDNVFFHGN